MNYLTDAVAIAVAPQPTANDDEGSAGKEASQMDRTK